MKLGFVAHEAVASIITAVVLSCECENGLVSRLAAVLHRANAPTFME